jgi:type I restriction enzyme S subunit
MSSKSEPVDMKQDSRPTLAPKLRFPEFLGAKDWVGEKVAELVSTVTPPKKIPTSHYVPNGLFPIIDQSQSDICGWTDDIDAVIDEDLPLIIFGDHTCILKLIERPFAQGADGIKILKSRPKIKASYLYQFLSHRPVVTEEYKRHYSILREKVVFFPNITTGEQQKIAECLCAADEVISAQAQKVDALKTYKRGLMQQLFPRDGEMQPRLRLPEFQDSGEWMKLPLSTLLLTSPDYGVNAAAVPFSEALPKYLRITDISEDGRYLPHKRVSVDLDAEDANYLDEGDIVLARTGASVGKSYQYRKVDGRLVFAGFLIRIKPDPERLISSYLANFLTSNQFWKWVAVTSARSGQPGINSTEYSSLTIPLPPHREEQKRIAFTLSALDDAIAIEIQKREALKIHKRGLMQQLFPTQAEWRV